MTKLIDSHVHIWDPAVNDYGWLSGELNRAYLPEEYHESAPQTTGVIFVQADAADGIREADWVSRLEWPQLLGIVAHAPLELGAGAASHLDRLDALGGVVGIRRLLQDEPLAFFDDGDLLVGLRLLAERGMPFDACVRHAQLPALTALARRVPELRVVLDHLGKPPVATGDDGTWARELRALAELPNVRVKLSGLAPEASPARGIREQVADWLLTCLDAFGPDRCMVGSDWPVSAVTPQRETAGQWLDHVLSDVAASAGDRQWLAWRSAADFYAV